MALNIVSLIGQYLTPEIVGKFAGMLGGNSGLAQKALGAAVPSVLSGILSSITKPDGADAFSRAVASQDTGILDNIGSLLSGDTRAFTNAGSEGLASILGGGRVGVLAQNLKDYAGLPEGTSGQLLGAVGPMVLAAIGKEAKGQHLDAQGTINMLMGQKDNIARMMPSDFASRLSGAGLLDGIADKMDLVGSAATGAATRAAEPVRAAASSVRPAVETVKRTAAPVAPPPVKAGTPWWYYALPLALLALLGWWFLGRPDPVVEEVAVETTEETTVAPAETAPAATTETAAAPVETTGSLMVGDVDVGATVTKAFADLTSSISGITDVASAETALPKLTEVRDSLATLDAPLAGADATVKSGLKALVEASLPALMTASDAALGNSAVKGVIGTVLEDILARLRAFAA